MAKTFMNNDTVGNAVTWSNDSILYLDYETVVMHCWNCRNRLSTSSTRIYGVKVINQSGTLFGWIRFKDIYVNTFSSGFTIEEYACNKGSVDLKDINESLQLQVFPNPCKNKIVIALSFPFKKCLFTLFDINGQILLTKPILDNEVQIDISSLSSGVYFIKLVTENKVIVRKLLKE
jgi:hypothetical protein